jgi:DUF1365 family protein
VRSHLLEGKVRHRRSRPVVYGLEHDVAYVALDLDELDAVDREIRLLSRNRRNVLSFRDADHWPAPAADIRATVLDHLRAQGEEPVGWRITLVTSVRILGFVFNPASFYLSRDTAGALRVVIVEVHNTPHLERHLYTLRPTSTEGPFTASMDKAFYVSPFIDMEGRYTVHVADDPARLAIAINERQDGEPLLSTSVVLTRRPMTNRNVLRMLVRYPFTTQKTVLAIYWHAFRLWRKGVTFHRHGGAVRPSATGAATGASGPVAVASGGQAVP